MASCSDRKSTILFQSFLRAVQRRMIFPVPWYSKHKPHPACMGCLWQQSRNCAYKWCKPGMAQIHYRQHSHTQHDTTTHSHTAPIKHQKTPAKTEPRFLYPYNGSTKLVKCRQTYSGMARCVSPFRDRDYVLVVMANYTQLRHSSAKFLILRLILRKIQLNFHIGRCLKWPIFK